MEEACQAPTWMHTRWNTAKQLPAQCHMASVGRIWPRQMRHALLSPCALLRYSFTRAMPF